MDLEEICQLKTALTEAQFERMKLCQGQQSTRSLSPVPSENGATPLATELQREIAAGGLLRYISPSQSHPISSSSPGEFRSSEQLPQAQADIEGMQKVSDALFIDGKVGHCMPNFISPT